MERNNPTTSTEAFKSVSPEMLSNHWGKIIEALRELKLATYEEISEFCKFEDKNRASRRLLEMERAELIYKPGTKKATKSGRLAYQYSLRNPDTVVIPPEKITKDTTTASDYANMIIAGTKQGILKQKKLFDEPENIQ